MISLLVIIVCLVAIITEILSVLWGWIILIFPTIYIIITLFLVKQAKWKYIPELSESANDMFQKFGHYYTMPFASRDYSASASILSFAAIIIAVIGAIKGFIWGIGIGVLYFIIMGFIARAFNPTCFLVGRVDHMAHEEIIEYVKEKQRSDDSDI
jgi:hypothetical protein